MPYNLRSKSRSAGAHKTNSSPSRNRSRGGSSELRRKSRRASKSSKNTRGHRRHALPSPIQISSPGYTFRSRTSSSTGSSTQLIWSPPLGLLGFPSAYRREIRRLCRLCNDNVPEPHRHEVPLEQDLSLSPASRRHPPRNRHDHDHDAPFDPSLSPHSPQQSRRSSRRLRSPTSSPLTPLPPELISPAHISPVRPPMDPALAGWLEQRKVDTAEKKRQKQVEKRAKLREQREREAANRTTPYLNDLPARQPRIVQPPMRTTSGLVEADRRVLGGRVRKPAGPSGRHARYPPTHEPPRYRTARGGRGGGGAVPPMAGPFYIPVSQFAHSNAHPDAFSSDPEANALTPPEMQPPEPPYALVTQYSRVPLRPPYPHAQPQPRGGHHHPRPPPPPRPSLQDIGRRPYSQQQQRGYPPLPSLPGSINGDLSDLDGHYELDDDPTFGATTIAPHAITNANANANTDRVPDDFSMSDSEFQDLLRSLDPPPLPAATTTSSTPRPTAARSPRSPGGRRRGRAQAQARRSPSIPDFDFDFDFTNAANDIDFGAALNELPDLEELGLPEAQVPLDPAILGGGEGNGAWGEEEGEEEMGDTIRVGGGGEAMADDTGTETGTELDDLF